jgi:hypothetical protein
MVVSSRDELTKEPLDTDDFPTSYNSQSLMSNRQLTKVCDFDFSYGAMKKIFVKGNYLYAILEFGGLLIFDISISHRPTLIGSFNDFQVNTGGFVNENLIYLGIHDGGVAIINVSNPHNPIKITTLMNVNIVYKFYMSKNLAFIVDAFRRILIYDISNPLKPILLSSLEYHIEDYRMEVNDLYLKGDLLYILFSYNLVILDISEPNNPIELIKYENISGLSFDFKDDYIFTTSFFKNNSIYFCKLNIYDFTDPLTAVNISTLVLNTTIDSKKVQVRNNLAFIYDDEIIIIDVSNISSPKVVGFYSQLSLLSENRIFYFDINDCYIDFEKKIIYCADFRNGLLIFDFNNYTLLFFCGFFNLGGKITNVFVNDNFVYTSDFQGTFYNPPSTFSIYKTENDFISLIPLGKYYPNKGIYDFVINEQYAYLSVTNSGIEILDISNPVEPQLISIYNNSLKYPKELSIDQRNKILYTTAGNKGLIILNISNPREPELITNYMQDNDKYFEYSDFQINDDLLVVKITGNDWGTGFSILNISIPSQPTILWSGYVSHFVTSISIFDDLLIVGKYYEIIAIYDISNPSYPKLLSTVDNDWFYYVNKIVTEESLVFIARDNNGLLVVDINNPKMARLVITIKDHYSGESYDVFVQGNYVFLADGWDGLEIFRLDSYKLRYIVFFVPIGGIIIVSFIVLTYIRKNKRE